MPEPSRIPCTKCAAMILPSTAKATDGMCMPCVKGLKIRRKKARTHSKAQNKKELFLSATILIPILIAFVAGLYANSLIKLDSWPLSRDWHGLNFHFIISKAVWLVLASLFIKAWAILLCALRILPRERANLFPFGATFRIND